MGSISPPFVVPLCIPNFIKGKQKITSDTLIELSSDTPGAQIFFTVNGQQPNPFEAWQLNSITWQYVEPIKLEGVTGVRTIKAMAVDEKRVNTSAVITKAFYVEDVSISPSKRKKKLKQSPAGVAPQTSGTTESVDVNTAMHDSEHQPIVGNDGLLQDICSQETDETSDIIFDAETVNSIIDSLVSIDNNYPYRESNISKLEEIIEEESENVLDEISSEHVNTTPTHPHTNQHEVNCDETIPHFLSDDDNQVMAFSLEEPKQNFDDDPNKCASILRHDIGLQCCLSTVTTYMESQEVLQSNLGKPATVEVCSKSTQTLEHYTTGTSHSQHLLEATVPDVPQELDEDVKHVLTINRETQTLYNMSNKETQISSPPENQQDILKPSVAVQQMKNNEKISPGRGFWRQQMDFITSCLKVEAYNNEEFRNNISEQRITKLNRVSVREGLDNLILVIHFALKNPTINIGRDTGA